MRSATFPQAPSHWHVHTARPSSNMVLKFPAPKRYLVRMSERRNREEAINLVWMRCGDLRTHDHEPLARALQAASPLPFFCLDDVQLGPSPEKGQLGLPSIGPYRLVALLRAVADVRSSLRGSGVNLICTSGKTEDCVRKLVTLVDGPAEIRPTHITLSYYADSGLADPIEKQIEDRVVKAFEDACSGMGLSYQIQPSWGATMHHPEDILSILHGSPRTFSGDPCSLESLYSISSMTEFARLVSSVPVRKPCKDLISPPPRNDQHAHAEQLGLRSLFAHDDDEMDGDAGCNMVQSARQIISCSRLPDVQKAHRRLSELVGFDIVQHLSDSMEPSVPVTETEARGALEALECLDDYKESRTLAWGNRVGAKLSACLSLGTLSPRTVYWGIVQKYFNSGASIQELHRFPPAASDPGHAWLLFHIKCIRDYFIFSSMIDVQDLVAAKGPRGCYPPEVGEDGWTEDDEGLQRWVRGQTGFPFVDASMRQLTRTGEMSNRCRQNVASFLTRTLGQDWRVGVEVFRALLLDHDAAINAENWAYVAGVGHDPRSQSRMFKTVTQGEKYDADGSFITHFIPQLAGLPMEIVHRPWTNAEGGVGYALENPPMVDPSSQIGRKKGG